MSSIVLFHGDIQGGINSVIQLFDIFLKWLDAQFAVGGIDFMINVEGP